MPHARQAKPGTGDMFIEKAELIFSSVGAIYMRQNRLFNWHFLPPSVFLLKHVAPMGLLSLSYFFYKRKCP